MKLELVVKQALRDNADCLGNECDCVAIGVAKAVREFLLSDEVVERAADGIKYDVTARYSFKGQARAALSSITGDE